MLAGGRAGYLAKVLEHPLSRLGRSAVVGLPVPFGGAAKLAPTSLPSVLVVEDNQLARDLLRLTLENDGYRVSEDSRL